MDVAPEIAEDDEHPPVRGELFGTETMAELCVRQGRVADALAIYRGLLRGLSGGLSPPPAAVPGSPDHERRHRWEQRLRDLEDPASASRRAVPVDKVPPRPAASGLPATGPHARAATIPPARAVAGGTVAGALATKTLRGAIHRLPLVVREPVRAGQIVYAEKNDLIVVGPVNPGAQLIADGNIHVYGRLRGRAVAGAHGATQARIYCQRLEAELIGIDSAYLTAEDIAPATFGQAVQVSWDAGRCLVIPL